MPLSKPDLVAIVAALAAHAGIAYGLAHVPERPPHRPEWVEVEMRKHVPPPPPKIELPPPPEPPKPKKIKIAPPPPVAPPPNTKPPEEPPKEPPKPVFGVTMSSTTEGDSSMAVNVGNTTMIDPKNSGHGPAVPLPAAPPPQAKPEYKPVSELYIKKMPDIDADACGRTIQYPSEAEQLGIEGDVKLRIELDDKGHVHGIKVLSGQGHGLDQAAVYALTHKCKFTPAIATDGKPVSYVIPSYVFHFEIPR
ncbi:MAG TPA: energy transducer TonB [Polyangia bacterium]|jgi:protein TonB|nr:energy transducer TonB [Polyangia bacterium]